MGHCAVPLWNGARVPTDESRLPRQKQLTQELKQIQQMLSDINDS